MGLNSMSREARIVVSTVALTAGIVLLALGFAWLRNLPGPGESEPDGAATPPPESIPGPSPERAAVGEAAFERLGCASCHSIDGRGNPSRPLDGVGARRDAAAIRAWTLGTGEAADALPGGVVRVKQGAAGDPDLEALIDYLASLR